MRTSTHFTAMLACLLALAACDSSPESADSDMSVADGMAGHEFCTSHAVDECPTDDGACAIRTGHRWNDAASCYEPVDAYCWAPDSCDDATTTVTDDGGACWWMNSICSLPDGWTDEGDSPTCPDLENRVCGDSPAIDEPGPFEVGYRTIEVSYTPATFDEERTLDVALWYPTEEITTPVTYRNVFRRDAVYADAALAGEEPLPVLVFSHGNQGFAEQSWFLAERLATHGWLVVAPNHKGNTILDFNVALTEVMRLFRPMDIVATLDAVQALEAPDPLAGRVSDRVALAGHSFGGFTTLLVGGAATDTAAWDALCAAETEDICPYWTDERRALVTDGFADTRFQALIPMAPSNKEPFAVDATSTITTPTLLFSGTLDVETPAAEHADPLWEAFSGADHTHVVFPAGGHFTFSNACDLGIGRDDGCGDEFVDPTVAHAAINIITLAWLNHYVLGGRPVMEAVEGPLSSSLSSHLEFRQAE